MSLDKKVKTPVEMANDDSELNRVHDIFLDVLGKSFSVKQLREFLHKVPKEILAIGIAHDFNDTVFGDELYTFVEQNKELFNVTIEVPVLPVLFSRTSTGAVQQWQIVIDGKSYYTVEGIKDGKMTTSVPTVCEGKNIGRANETSAEEQAMKEAKAKWKKKTEAGYFENIDEIDSQVAKDVMLAHVYGEHPTSFPCGSQPKLDGMRCECRADGMWSRNHKPIVSAPHIRKALDHLYKKFPTLKLDGELYCDKLKRDFNKIISLVKKSKPTAADLKESEETIQYWVYDISSSDKGFKQRNEELNKLLADCPGCIVIVDTTFVQTQAELDELYGKYLDHGFEGQMVRSINGLYENKRSKNLLKRKEFIDSEYTVVEVCEGVGNRSGMAGYMVLKMDDGRTFKSNIKGSHEYLKELLIDKAELVGKIVTVKYFCLTPDGIPRFPFVIAVRDYE